MGIKGKNEYPFEKYIYIFIISTAYVVIEDFSA